MASIVAAAVDEALEEEAAIFKEVRTHNLQSSFSSTDSNKVVISIKMQRKLSHQHQQSLVERRSNELHRG